MFSASLAQELFGLSLQCSYGCLEVVFVALFNGMSRVVIRVIFGVKKFIRRSESEPAGVHFRHPRGTLLHGFTFTNEVKSLRPAG